MRTSGCSSYSPVMLVTQKSFVPICVCKQLSFKILDYTASSCYVDPKTVSLYPNVRYYKLQCSKLMCVELPVSFVIFVDILFTYTLYSVVCLEKYSPYIIFPCLLVELVLVCQRILGASCNAESKRDVNPRDLTCLGSYLAIPLPPSMRGLVYASFQLNQDSLESFKWITGFWKKNKKNAASHLVYNVKLSGSTVKCVIFARIKCL